MPDFAKKQVDFLIGRSVLTVEALAAEVRARLIRRVIRTRKRFFMNHGELIAEARSVLSEFEPILAQTIADVELAAWIAGTQAVAGRIPLSRQAQFIPPFGPPPQKPPSLGTLLGGGEEYEPIIRFPLIENAAKSLAERNILTPREFAETAAEVKRQAFTVAGQASEQTIEKIRDALVETIDDGPSLKVFRAKVEQAVEAGGIGPGHLETVFRTNTQTAFHQGYDEILQHPVVAELFPYQEYLPIHDGRVRPEHRALGELGIDGTGIYRRDDPFWDVFTPPWDFNCLLPGTIIQGRIELVSRSWYSGQAVEIVSGTSQRLRVTVNHPVLTPSGFVPAGMLKNGDNILRYRGQQHGSSAPNYSVPRSAIMHATYDPRRFSPDVNKDYCPTAIADVFASLALHRKLTRFPLMPDDLHGDAMHCKGNVDVVAADWELPNGLVASLNNAGSKFPFVSSDVFSSPLEAADSDGLFGSVSHGPAACRTPSSTALANHSGGVALEARPLRQLCLGTAAYLNASRYELPPERVAVAAGLASQFLERCAGAVFVDQVTKIRRFDFCGHVYDAQSAGGWLVGDSVIMSNCRCGINALTIEAAARKGVKEAAEWLRTGVRPPLESRLPFINFRPAADWGRRPRIAA